MPKEISSQNATKNGLTVFRPSGLGFFHLSDLPGEPPVSIALAMKLSGPALSLGPALSIGLALLSSTVGEQCSGQELREQMTALLREQTETLRAELRDTRSQLESKIEQQAVRDLPYVRVM